MRTAPENVAVKAVGILVKLNLNDTQSAEVFWQRLEAGAGEALRPALLRGLGSMAEHIPPPAVADLYRLVKNQPLAKDPEALAVLATAYARAAGDDGEAFDLLAGVGGAGEAFREKVRLAIASKDPAEARAAAEIVPLLGLLQKGLRGSYYSGVNFEKLLFERMDEKILIENGKSTYPDGRNQNISIRWTGKVVVPVAGKYTFYPASDDGIRLWVAGKKIVESWASRAITENAASIDLPQGMHEIKVEYFQGGGDFGVHLKWQGPGTDKQLLTGKNLLSAPAPPKAPSTKKTKP